jgi:hypothetical protein
MGIAPDWMPECLVACDACGDSAREAVHVCGASRCLNFCRACAIAIGRTDQLEHHQPGLLERAMLADELNHDLLR